MNKQFRSYSNRIRTARKEQLDAQRREFLNLENAEPNLGFPTSIDDPIAQPFPGLDHVLIAREDGTKEWTQRPVGIKIDGDLSQIINKHRFDSGFVPTLEEVGFGEILINSYDAKIYTRTLRDGVEGIAEIQTGIQGAQGTQGIQGIQGERMPFIPIEVVGSVENVQGTYPNGGPNDPQGALNSYFPNSEIGDAVFDEQTSDLWVWVGATWINVGVLRGPQGVQGSFGPQGVQGRPGIQGFTGLQGTRGFIGVQGIQGNRGIQGIQGSIGRSLRLLGTVNQVNEIPEYPLSASGTEVGDSYIVLEEGNIYIWSGAEWFNGGRIIIQGTQGIQGVQGPVGPQGVRGFPLKLLGTYNDINNELTAEFLQAEYPNADPFSAVVDVSSGQGVMWQTFGAGAWTNIGPVSVQGVQGPSGPQSSQGVQGVQGNRGIQGIQGVQGSATKIIDTYNNTLEPLSSELLNDLYPLATQLNAVVDITSGNGVMWQKNELGVWEEIGLISVQGIQGQSGTGIQGLQGSSGIQGIQGTLGIQGVTGQSIQGFSGTQGLQGLQGIQGNLGLQGPIGEGIQGSNGIQGLQGIQGNLGIQGIQGAKVPYTLSETPPLNPEVGDLWLDSSTGIKFQWVFDGNSSQWVEVFAAIQGIQGIQGEGNSFWNQTAQGISTSENVGIGTQAINDWKFLVGAGLIRPRLVVNAVSNIYTLDVKDSNEFVTAAAINGAVTVNLSNLDTIPVGYVWEGVLSFQYTSGSINWFGGNSGYTVKWDGNLAMALTPNEVETVIIRVVGGSNIIDITAVIGRTA